MDDNDFESILNSPSIMPPYIGLTGITTPEEVGRLDIPKIDGYDIMLGILVSSKSLRGQTGPRYPEVATASAAIEAIRSLGRRDILPAIHYCTRAFNMDELKRLVNDLAMFDIIQLNVADPDTIKQIAREIGSLWLPVFQINKTIAKRFGVLGTMAFFEGIRCEEGYALFDMSGGRGKPMDIAAAIEFKKLATKFKKLRLGVAGGLTPDTIKQTIAQCGKDISYDIESGVRDQDDRLDIDAANRYLANAARAIG